MNKNTFLPLWTGLLIVLGLTVACVARPAPTPPPAPAAQPTTAAPALEPTVTHTPYPTIPADPLPAGDTSLPAPLQAAADLAFAGWSPAGDWFAFRASAAEQVEAARGPELEGTIHLINAATGEMCQHPADTDRGRALNRGFDWLPDGRILLNDDSNLLRLAHPCRDEVEDLSSLFPEPILSLSIASCGNNLLVLHGAAGLHFFEPLTDSVWSTDALRGLPIDGLSFSPGCTHLGATQPAGTTHVLTTATGELESTIPWDFSLGGLGNLGGPIWLNEGQFLIHRSDNGPLFVTLGAEPKPVAPAFFGRPATPYQSVTGGPIPGSEEFYLLLTEYDADYSSSEIWLYHSGSGLTEQLDAAHAWLTDTGRWLVLTRWVEVAGYQQNQIWVRLLEPAGAEPTLVSDWPEVDYPSFSPDETAIATANEVEPGKLATVEVRSVPAGQPIQIWELGNYNFYSLHWSPGGRSLVAIGQVPVADSSHAFPWEREYALFLLPVAEPTGSQHGPAITPPAGLVYATTAGLWRVQANGQSELIFDSPEAILSPDGQRVLLSDQEGIRVIELSTGERRNLLANWGFSGWGMPRWGTNEIVLFGSWPAEGEWGPSEGYPTAAAADGSWLQVLNPESESGGTLAVSPDGTTFAADQWGTGWLMQRGGSVEPIDLSEYDLPTSADITIGSPAWSPDGRYLAWMIGGNFEAGRRVGVLLLDLEARRGRLLHLYENLGRGGWFAPPVWSSDGRWFAFVSEDVQAAQRGLWVIAADGSEEHLLGPGAGPVWNPAGQQLTFTEHLMDDKTAVWLVETGLWERQLLDLPAGVVVVGWVEPTLPSTAARPAIARYSNPTLGFAVDYPADWAISEWASQIDPLGRWYAGVEFLSNLYGYGEQAFGKYIVTVAVSTSAGRTLTEAVEYRLSPIIPQMRDGITSTCCLMVGGQPAVELLGFPFSRWGSREIIVIHRGHEYWLTFSPTATISGNTPSDSAARSAFDTFLYSFVFIPITATPLPPAPTVTPAPTPTTT